MSQENVEVVRGVRIPLVPETRRHRSLDERILVRFPALARRLGAAWGRLPRQSRLRRAMLVRAVRRGWAASNRRDFALQVVSFDADFEIYPAPFAPGFDAIYHGHDGYRQVWRVVLEAIEDVRFEPEELLDLGDRFLVTVRWIGHGTGSGASFDQTGFHLFTVRRGLVIRQQDFFDRAEALETLGLSE